MEEYKDIGGLGYFGCTWDDKDTNISWNNAGGDYTEADVVYQTFETGLEEMKVDITSIVEKWLSNVTENNGLLVKLSGSQEDLIESDLQESFYTKKFSARTTQFFFSKPNIAAVWDESKKDNRNNFKLYNPFKDSEYNKNYLYIYETRDLQNYPTIVSLYSSSDYSGTPFASSSVGRVERGIYSASFSNILSYTSSIDTIYDKWTSGSFGYKSSSVNVYTEEDTGESLLKITNLKNIYSSKEVAKFNIFSRQKNWSPNIYTIAYSDIQASQIDNLLYKVTRFQDNLVVLDYETGSVKYTNTSYDKNGNYFNLDMSLLEPDYTYQLSFAIYDGEKLEELKDKFKFKVE
jgi:hypothetical protein